MKINIKDSETIDELLERDPYVQSRELICQEFKPLTKERVNITGPISLTKEDTTYPLAKYIYEKLGGDGSLYENSPGTQLAHMIEEEFLDEAACIYFEEFKEEFFKEVTNENQPQGE